MRALRSHVPSAVLVAVAGAATVVTLGAPALAAGNPHGHAHPAGHGTVHATGQSTTGRQAVTPAGHGRPSAGKAGPTTGKPSPGKPSPGRPTSSAGGHNPPGNNGTVFVHDVAGDHKPHNVPHVSCTFYVDFFGIDTKQVADVTISGQAPTGPGVTAYGPHTFTISPDAAGGAGNDWDSELAFTTSPTGTGNVVDTSRLGAPAHQGFHLRLSVDVAGAPGGAKTKVFWVEPCAATPASPAGSPGSTVSPGTPGAPGTSVGATGGTRGGTTIAARPGTTMVLAESATRAPSTAATSGRRPAAVEAVSAVRSGSLPFTGAVGVVLLSLIGVAALAIGTALALTGRRRANTAG